METTVKDTAWSSLKARGSKTNKKKSSEEIFRRKYRIIFEASEKEKNSGRQREWTALMGSREDRVVKKRQCEDLRIKKSKSFKKEEESE